MNVFKKLKGEVTVQIEGFFTERFINICKVNNIKIWNIVNITNGIIRFNMLMDDFKKLRKVAKKSKCKVKIKKKKGLYFQFFKYRKRKWLFALLGSILLIFVFSTTFIWKIQIQGENIDIAQVKERIKKYGIHVGSNHLLLDKNLVIKQLRGEFDNTSWIGLEINGTTATVKFVEKIYVKDKQDERIGDIVSLKEGILTKIIPENGTAMYKQGSFITKDLVLIRGAILSKVLPEKLVHAKGIVRANVSYIFEKEYPYQTTQKQVVGNKKYSIGFSYQSKEFYINYLNKNRKYDTIKHSKKWELFGKTFSADFYEFSEYEENEITQTKEQIELIGEKASKEYIQEQMKTMNTPEIMDEKIELVETKTGIIYKKIYTINEEVGVFVERN